MRKVNFKILLSFIFLSITSSLTAQINLESTIVRIKSGGKISTGFFWKNGSTIITTLHSIGNSNHIEVCLSGTLNWIPAKLIKIHKGSDLAMLKVRENASTVYLSELYPQKPTFHTKCYTIGYNSGNPNYISREFTVGVSEKNILRSVLPNTLWTEVPKWGFLSLTTEIVYLEGQLLHGFSGSPIVDFHGKLLGVADGGLENGAAGISWCINASYLTILESSNEELKQVNQAIIKNLFAAEEYEYNNDEKIIELNEFKFKKIKTRSFAQMDITGKYSSEDALGLLQLLKLFSSFNYSSFLYDVYLEENSGATIVLPSGNNLKTENGLLVSGNKKIEMYISIENTTDIQHASEIFEGKIMPNYYSNWITDQQWSYPFPYPGPNNSFVRRRAYYGNNLINYLFEALAKKNEYFLGTAIKKDNSLIINMSDQEEWAKYVIAIQLSSFTN